MADRWPFVDNVLDRYDVHIYFDANDAEDVQSAVTLKESLERKFPDVPVFPLIHEPIGPHVKGQFEAHIETSEQFGRVVPWLCLNHKHHSILVHPIHTDESLSGYDHTRYPLWLGKVLPLDLSIFTNQGKLV